MGDYHEPYELLDPHTRDLHRATTSVKEELEAIDWYSHASPSARTPRSRRC
ncbi:MAG TPA: hypothetical protein VEQ10_08655 [Vicinamibacteria bacterium]|nr:hypothetical protein [Vicinamibacteria bacterium]